MERHAGETSTLADISLLNAATDNMEAAWERGDLITNVDDDLVFHRHIAGKSRNFSLLRGNTSLSAMMMETQCQPIPFTALDRMTCSIAEHRAITAALHNRDPDAAQAAMVAHIRNTAACAGISI